MTLMDMLQQGDVTSLACMGGLFCLIAFMLYNIGRGIALRSLGEKEAQPVVSAAGVSRAGNDAVTAAISAAVNEYKKNN
ncbi:MAG: hypothetical protein FWB83_03675 [Treponema sp.]|nr:hypothetical protein [Treponema sp.]